MQRILSDVRSHILMVLFLFFAASVGCGDDAGAKKSEGAQADSTKTDSTKVANKDDKKKVREGVPVKVMTVVTGEISEHVLYSATVEAEATVDIYSQASGLVRRILVEEGAKVSVGQVLVELVDDELKLDELEAKLAYQKIEAQLRRKAELFNRKLLAKEEYEDLRMSVEQSKIRWERARLSLAYAHVRAPVDGVISQRLVKIGDRVGQSAKLYEMVNLSRLIAHVHVPGQGMQNLSMGQRALVTTDFLPDSKFEGRILRISPVVDPGSGTFKVTLELDADDRRLRPGMFVNAHIVTATHMQAVLVPKRAVVYDDGMPHVFVVSDSMALKKQFDIGFDDSEHVEVVSGIDKGDLIVVVGQNGLKDKAKVRIIDGEGLRIPAKPDSNATEKTPKDT
ncbi:MAG: efflux RND transporter periplasmic adaptor subunit [Candidatus Latescibacteria bacterium]|jgi:membrane fusion protein, multidrug efflux system|nr:efflux RND transporter periplasmic adaptor subunit [Candidatus Latescibacterota bacterium]